MKTFKDKQFKDKIVLRTLALAVIALVFALGFVLGRLGFNVAWENGKIHYSITGQLTPEEKDVSFDRFWEVWGMLEDQYVDKNINKEDMVNGAIKGMVAALSDRATRYFTAEDTSDYENGKAGMLQGIGIEMSYLDGSIVIKQIFDNSPAKTSGLAAGDIIQKVDGQDTSLLDISDVAMKIRGEKGTSVTLEVYRSSEDKNYTFTVTREEVYIESISYELLQDNIGLITFRRFTEDTLPEFYAAWDKVAAKAVADNPKGIIIDLRGNGGGYLEAAVYVAGEFLDKGEPILYVQDRESNVSAMKVTREGALKNTPLVILVDGGTASSSEIFAGALQYYHRATIIGKNTYGKGTTQDVIKPPSWGGASIHITTQKWLLPDKRWITNENPIVPDIEVSLTTQELLQGEDPQLDRAKAELNK